MASVRFPRTQIKGTPIGDGIVSTKEVTTMNLNISLRTACLALVVGAFAFSVKAETPAETAMDEDFSRAYKQIDELGKNKDTAGLVRKADEISRDWKPRSMDYYGRLIVHLCAVLRTHCADKGVPIKEITEISERALQTYDARKESNISIEEHYWLVSGLQARVVYAKDAMTDEEWATKRKGEAERWMIVWDRMEAAIDPKWDKNDLPVRNVSPPREAHLPAGVSPDDIKDPALRAEYEKAIEENNKKIKHGNEQMRLRKLKEQFARSLVLYFAGTYSVTPHNDSELESLLAQHVKDEKVKKAVLDALDAANRGVPYSYNPSGASPPGFSF
jgi:hypothetical protein